MKTGGLFITGTDTGVGKTWVTTRLLRQLREKGIRAVGMKPVECGGREDSLALFAASGGAGAGLTLDEVNPLTLPEPLAPAAATDRPVIDLDAMAANYERLARRYDAVLVEGAGGWLVPLDSGRTMADLAAKLGLPVLIVAANRLGALNHCLLTVRAVQEAGLVCRGIYLNRCGEAVDLSQESNGAVLREILPGIDVFDGEVAEIFEGR